MLGATRDQARARRLLEGAISRHVAPARLTSAVPFQYGRPNTNSVLSRILWRQGFPDHGLALAERNVQGWPSGVDPLGATTGSDSSSAARRMKGSRESALHSMRS